MQEEESEEELKSFSEIPEVRFMAWVTGLSVTKLIREQKVIAGRQTNKCIVLVSPDCHNKAPQTGSFFFFFWSFFNNLFIFNWRITALQFCVGFCHTST